MTILSLSADKTIARGGEIINFTANYPGEVGKNIILMQKGFSAFNDVAVGNALTNSSGIAVITWSPATSGKFDFYAIHSIVPGISDCGLWCEKSGLVTVSVTDAPSDPTDILNNITGGIGSYSKNMQLIIAVAIIIVIVLIFIFYMPKKR
jgi:hypothetical protein